MTTVNDFKDAHTNALREVLAGGDPVREREHARDLAARLESELADVEGRYGVDGEVWCGARRDQAGTAYCVEMAGHEQHSIGHMWHEQDGNDG